MTARRGVATSDIRAAIIDAAEAMLIAEGAAALTAGRLAQAVGLSRPSVHYYFGTIDDLMVALLDRQAGLLHDHILHLPPGENPLRAAWQRRSRSSSFTFEIMTMALRRPLIRDALHRQLGLLRRTFSQSIARYFEGRHEKPPLDPDAMATAFLAMTQALTIDRAMGIDIGHAALTIAIEAWLDRMEPCAATPSSPSE